jgi:hypothetical protein
MYVKVAYKFHSVVLDSYYQIEPLNTSLRIDLNSPSKFSQSIVAIPFHFTQKRLSFLGASHPIFDIGEKWDSQAVPFKGKPTRLLDLDFGEISKFRWWILVEKREIPEVLLTQKSYFRKKR